MQTSRLFRGMALCAFATTVGLLSSPLASQTPRPPAPTIRGLDTPAARAPSPQQIVVKFRDGTLRQRDTARGLQRVAEATATALRTDARVVASTFAVSPQVNYVGVAPVMRLAAGGDVVAFSRRLAAGEADAIARTLSTDPDIEYAEADRIAQRASTPPNDPWFSGPVTIKGKSYTNVQADLYDPKGGIGAPGAWAQSASGRGVVVAVLDTGITAHPDLDGNVVPGAGYDFLTDTFYSGREIDGRVPGGWDTGDWTNTPPWSQGCAPENSSWHGSHVAGTIAAVTGNGVGIAAVAPDAKLLPVRVLGHCGGNFSDIADAVVWASGGHVEGVPANETPAQVINMSLGGHGTCPAYMQSAIDAAVARGTTVVVAAGNSNLDMAQSTPANCKNVIAVASNGLTGKRAYYSNWGPLVDVAAPGGGKFVNDGLGGTEWIPGGFIWSTIDSGKTVPEAPAYGGYIGTSMAAPHVAGIVALMQSVAKSPMSPADVEMYIKAASRTFPVAPDRPIGAGIADAKAAVTAAILGQLPKPAPVRVGSGQLLPNLSAVPGQSHAFVIDAPAGAGKITFRTFGGTGDADLFVAFGKPVDLADTEMKLHAIRPGNNGYISVTQPLTGSFYVLIRPTRAYQGLYFQASVD
jgi:serine protease